jgi:hypothetical protein
MGGRCWPEITSWQSQLKVSFREYVNTEHAGPGYKQLLFRLVLKHLRKQGDKWVGDKRLSLTPFTQWHDCLAINRFLQGSC